MKKDKESFFLFLDTNFQSVAEARKSETLCMRLLAAPYLYLGNKGWLNGGKSV